MRATERSLLVRADVSKVNAHMDKSIVCLVFSGNHKPIAKIVDMKTQAICALIARDGEHLTVHQQKESEKLLFTYYSKTKVPSTWDSAKVELAKKLGYTDPERHGRYIFHDNSSHRNNLRMNCYNLCGDEFIIKKVLVPLIGLEIHQGDYLEALPKKYEKLSKYLLPADEPNYWLSISFTSKLDEFEMTDLQPIETTLSYFSFSVNSLDEKMHQLFTNLWL